MARNLARNEARRFRREHLVAKWPFPEPAVEPDPPPDPFLARLIRRCLGRLAPRPREAIRARMKEGHLLADAALAEGLGMSLNTFLQNIVRGRRQRDLPEAERRPDRGDPRMNDPMSASEREALVEAVLSPHRVRDADGRLTPPPAWWDLPPESLDSVYRKAIEARRLEREAHPRGASGTVAAVMAWIGGGGAF